MIRGADSRHACMAHNVPALRRAVASLRNARLAAGASHVRTESLSAAEAAGRTRIDDIRRQIADGTYLTEEKIDVVVDELFRILRHRPVSKGVAVA